MSENKCDMRCKFLWIEGSGMTWHYECWKLKRPIDPRNRPGDCPLLAEKEQEVEK